MEPLDVFVHKEENIVSMTFYLHKVLLEENIWVASRKKRARLVELFFDLL